MENSNTKNKDKIIFKSHTNFSKNDKTIETTQLNKSTNKKNNSNDVEIVTIYYDHNRKQKLYLIWIRRNLKIVKIIYLVENNKTRWNIRNLHDI